MPANAAKKPQIRCLLRFLVKSGSYGCPRKESLPDPQSEQAASTWLSVHPEAVLLSLEEAALVVQTTASMWTSFPIAWPEKEEVLQRSALFLLSATLRLVTATLCAVSHLIISPMQSG